jgi:bifunctional UDP-N-acetylglucosamine pyrophosphorylase/glucosamine-1-phosphate N-acetyltransferase
MFKVRFEALTTLQSQAELRQAFHTDRVYLGPDSSVAFEGDVSIGPEVMLVGGCRFSGPIQIEKGCVLTNVRLGRGNVVRAYSILTDTTAGDRNLFGPFCFIRDNCVVADDCILGAHVEAARSTFGSGVKISHRAFVGDAKVGEQTIIGAGVVFCNFDGSGRQPTQVGPRVTVGSGTLLVPPLTIGADSIIAAGSTVTKDVPAGAKVIQKRAAQSRPV